MNVTVVKWYVFRWVRYRELVLHFVAVAAGVLIREACEGLNRSAGYRLEGARLILALIGALVTFHALQQALEQRDWTPRWVRLLLAFQYGFCWRAVVGLEG